MSLLESLPSVCRLPPVQDDGITILADVPPTANVALLSNGNTLALRDNKVLWADTAGAEPATTIAGLRIDDGRLEFRWVGGVPSAAESAVRNAVFCLSDGSETHYVAAREPVKVEAPKWDSTRSVQRIVGECESPPRPEDVRFELTGAGALPSFVNEGDDLTSLKIGDEAFMAYSGVEAATQIRLRSSGEAVVVELDTRYQLPSGDKEPLSRARGNRVMNQLAASEDDALAARVSLSQLQLDRARTHSTLSRARFMRTGGSLNGRYIDNPAAVAAKALGIRQLENQLAATDRAIARAQQMINQLPSIRADLGAIEQIAEFSRSLDGTPLSYRFYAVVGDCQVTLIEGALAGP